MAKAYAALEEKPDRNVVFIRVPIDIAPKVFSFHSIVSAPSISFLSSTEVLGKKVAVSFSPDRIAQCGQRLPAGVSRACREHRLLPALQDSRAGCHDSIVSSADRD